MPETSDMEIGELRVKVQRESIPRMASPQRLRLLTFVMCLRLIAQVDCLSWGRESG